MKNCIQCNKEFIVSKVNPKVHKFCSNACKCASYRPVTKLKQNRWTAMATGSRRRDVNSELTKEILAQLFEYQQGKCALTGFDLELGIGTGQIYSDNHLKTASVDRIDSSKGYTLDNVRLVCRQANMMKSILTDEQLVIWCEAITNLHKEAVRKGNKKR